LTRINCGFKVNSVLIRFLGDMETTQPLIGHFSCWPRRAGDVHAQLLTFAIESDRMTGPQDRGRREPTHRSRRRSCQRTTGLPWYLTFAIAVEKVGDGDSGRSRVHINDRDKIATKRLLSKATN